MLPLFVTLTKDQRGHEFRIHLIGSLEHALACQLRLYTMTDNHPTGLNHILETVHRVINGKALNATLRRKFFLELDNCSRKKKNKYVMAFMECLVHWSVFDEVEVRFLILDHTQSDIDQTFRTTSRRLKTPEAIILEEMHNELLQ